MMSTFSLYPNTISPAVYFENEDVRRQVWDAASTSAIALGGFPFVGMAIHGAPPYAWFAVGVIATVASTAGLKHLNAKYLQDWREAFRPEGALNCGVTNSDGDCSGEPALPSGHVAVASFVFAYAWFSSMARGISPVIYLSIASATCGAIAVSRIKKKCHTPSQVIMGAVLGVALAYTFSRFKPRMFAK